MFNDLMDLDFIFLRLQQIYSKILYDRQSVIIFDEVQTCPKARQAIKYLVQDGRHEAKFVTSLLTAESFFFNDARKSPDCPMCKCVLS